MNKIAFKIIPSPSSNDHQVRIKIDEVDFLGEEYLGIDPFIFFLQEKNYINGELLIGRCTCGCEGCGDYSVSVSLDGDVVIWSDLNGLTYEFKELEYKSAIKNIQNDHSWEDNNRRVERLVSDLLKQTKTKDNCIFDWASTRIKMKRITLSYSKNCVQQLFEIDWDGQSPESGLENVKRFIETTNLIELNS